ncbi:MAG: DUF47 family protein [Candidatus Obscuribacterales bacterium]
MGTQAKFNLFGGLFEPSADFYDMLSKQANKTLEGMEALQEWLGSQDEDARGQDVRDREREADELKFALGKKLVETFITPFDREDVYDLSLSLDEVINAAKGTVREVEAFEVPRQVKGMCDLAALLVEGTRCLAAAFAALRTDRREAAEQALMARKIENKVTKAYRLAISELFEEDDIKRILRFKEVYKTLLLAAEKIDVVGEKLLHAIIKMG